MLLFRLLVKIATILHLQFCYRKLNTSRPSSKEKKKRSEVNMWFNIKIGNPTGCGSLYFENAINIFLGSTASHSRKLKS
jgi:hypothetical protein